jgi:hypothetical protein
MGPKYHHHGALAQSAISQFSVQPVWKDSVLHRSGNPLSPMVGAQHKQATGNVCAAAIVNATPPLPYS